MRENREVYLLFFGLLSKGGRFQGAWMRGEEEEDVTWQYLQKIQRLAIGRGLAPRNRQ
jgi:hypothetical protein